MSVWFPSCRAAQKKSPWRAINSALKIISCSLQTQEELNRKRHSSIKDTTQPGHSLFELVPSGRRHKAIRSRTEKQLQYNCNLQTYHFAKLPMQILLRNIFHFITASYSAQCFLAISQFTFSDLGGFLSAQLCILSFFNTVQYFLRPDWLVILSINLFCAVSPPGIRHMQLDRLHISLSRSDLS